MKHFFNTTIDVVRITRTNSALGSDETTTTLHDDLAAKWVWSNGDEAIVVGKVSRKVEASVFTSVVDIKSSDRITYDSNSYEILDVQKHNNTLNKYLKIRVGRLR